MNRPFELPDDQRPDFAQRAGAVLRLSLDRAFVAALLTVNDPGLAGLILPRSGLRSTGLATFDRFLFSDPTDGPEHLKMEIRRRWRQVLPSSAFQNVIIG